MLKRERKAVAGSREKISENAIADGHMRTELEKLMDAENVRRKEEAGERQDHGGFTENQHRFVEAVSYRRICGLV